MVAPGSVFWDKLPGEPVRHLRIVLTHPDTDGCVIVVNVTDLDNRPSFGQLLVPGQHAEITKKSTVMIHLATKWTVAEVREKIDAQLALPLLHMGHLKRVIDAVKNSREAPHSIRLALGWVPGSDSASRRFPKRP